MNKIQKVIPMESLRSRLSSIVPAYDMSGTCHYFTDHTSHPYSNYGMIPCDVVFNFETINNGSTVKEQIQISFQTISKLYHLFLPYKNNTLSETDISNIQIYINDYINNKLPSSSLNDLKGFILKRCIPTFFISKTYKKEWDCEYLTYDEVIKWKEWFELYNKCDDKEADENIKKYQKENCCECKKYKKLGGNDFYEEIDNFLSEAKLSSKEYAISSFYIPININNSIDDLGIMTPIIRQKDSSLNTENNSETTPISEEPISGITSSKISTFLKNQILVHDNIGNKFFGKYQKNEKGFLIEITPPTEREDGTFYKLEIPYEINDVSNLEEIVDLKENDVQYYWGNIITDIRKVVDTNDELDDNDIRITDENNYENGDIIEIEYYIGTLIEKKDGIYQIYIDNEQNKSYGIKYIDRYTIEKKEGVYYKNISESFKIEYNDLIPEYITYTNQDYNIDNIKAVKSIFEFYYPLDLGIDFYEKNEGNDEIINNIREEHNIGKSSIEKIESDIYIDRGNGQSFIPHLRLLEVKSLESLEQIGNGLFNII